MSDLLEIITAAQAMGSRVLCPDRHDWPIHLLCIDLIEWTNLTKQISYHEFGNQLEISNG
jgi:hypothetical protein